MVGWKLDMLCLVSESVFNLPAGWISGIDTTSLVVLLLCTGTNAATSSKCFSDSLETRETNAVSFLHTYSLTHLLSYSLTTYLLTYCSTAHLWRECHLCSGSRCRTSGSFWLTAWDQDSRYCVGQMLTSTYQTMEILHCYLYIYYISIYIHTFWANWCL